jgi:hypothetical protein
LPSAAGTHTIPSSSKPRLGSGFTCPERYLMLDIIDGIVWTTGSREPVDFIINNRCRFLLNRFKVDLNFLFKSLDGFVLLYNVVDFDLEPIWAGLDVTDFGITLP